MIDPRILAAAVPLLMAALPSVGLAAGSLPGGASSLTERHGDWVVNCASTEGTVTCSASQVQVDKNTKQRLLAFQFQISADTDRLVGTLIMPFGLRLTDGVTPSIDDKEPIKPLPFSTCLPAGCIVRIAENSPAFDLLAEGNTLNLAVTADDTGQKITFPVSLEGLSAAVARVDELSE
ncbi:invasion associated locus B family protein [Oricola sp.]|uniref:invasion associated locus B family protein n=2 Tax=Oricola sp. TaxID=1979950 RepID=UPI000C96CBB4|nr:hypothetical protein [Ahrensia sp.]